MNQQRGTAVFEPDRYAAMERAKDAIAGSGGQDLGDELRRQAESLAYKAAKDYERALRRIENELVTATDKDNRLSEDVRSMALDIVRTHMVRGLMRAQLEAGTAMTFWVKP